MIRLLSAIFFLFLALNAPVMQASTLSVLPADGGNSVAANDTVIRENRKLTAVLLTVTLGMLGVHRLYLGTKPWVPAVYLLTFGGGFFILPLIDLIAILSSNDLSKFENNSRIFMWIKPDNDNSGLSP